MYLNIDLMTKSIRTLFLARND